MSTIDFDVGSLIWVKAEIDSAIGLARQHVANYAANTSDVTQLKFASTHLHQATGAIEMVGLPGLTAFTQAVESLLAHLIAEQDKQPQAAIALLEQALNQVSEYIAALIDGAPNTALKLFETYQALFEARGSHQYAESDLFYPDLLIALPEHLKSSSIALVDNKVFNRNRRVVYQQSLISFIRHGAGDSFAKMATTVDELAKHQSTNALRAFWWVAAKFVATLGLNPRLQGAGKPLLSKLDQQMRRLVDGTPKAPEHLLRQMLYLIAIAEHTTPEIEEVKTAYQLAAQLPVDTEGYLVPLVSAQEVRSLKNVLEQIKDTWTRVTTLQADKLPHFLALLKQLSGQLKTDELGVLAPLFDGVSVFAEQLPVGQMPLEKDAMGVATALLLGETALEQYPNWNASLPEQIRYALAKLNGQAAESNVLDEIAQLAQEKLLQAQVAHEISGSLQQIEQHLDTYFRDTTQRNILIPVVNLMHQVDGALMMLGAENGSHVVRLAADRVQQWRQSEQAAAQAEMESVAEMLSALGFYVEALQNQRQDANDILRTYLGEKIPAQVIETPVASPEVLAPPIPEVIDIPVEPTFTAPEPVIAPASVVSSDAPVDEASDADLLDIYLEEAGEILANLGMHVEACRINPHERDSLTTIRRSFHTLKGSGRMVGLTHLGEAAWGVEQVMNRWLQEDRIAQPELLDLIEYARQCFARWIASLADEGKASVDAEALQALVDAFKAWQDGPLPKVVLDPVMAAPSTNDPLATVFSELPSLDLSIEDDSEVLPLLTEVPEAVAEDVADASLIVEEVPIVAPSEYTIGEVTISAVLYGIFIAEANKHLATLNTQMEVVANGGAIQSEFTHAAHTLRGIGNTTGFLPVGQLADALEQYLLARQVSHAPLDDHAFGLMSEAIGMLHQMVESIEQYLPPESAEELVARLKVLPAEEPQALSLEQHLEALDAEVIPQDALVSEAQIEETPTTFSVELEDELPSIEGLSVLDELEPADELLDLPVNDLLMQIADHTPAADEDAWGDVLSDQPGDAPLVIEEIDGEEAIDAMPVELVDEEESLPELVLEEEVSLDEVAAFQGLSAEPMDEGLDSSVVLSEQDDDLIEMPIEDMLQQAMEHLPSDMLVMPIETAIEPLAAVPVSTAPSATSVQFDATDEIDEQLLPVFLEEADELLPQIGETLRAWRDNPADDAHVRQLLRNLHTLKGSARMAGAMRMGELTHAFETRVQQAVQIGLLDDALFDGFENEVDLLNQYRDVLANPEQLQDASSVAGSGAVDGVNQVAAAAPVVLEKAELSPAEADAQATLRVKADLIDRLVNEAGEVSIARARIDSEVRGLKQSLFELTDNVNRLRSQLRELEIQAESQMQSRLSILHEGDEAFDPLEFDRFTRLQELTRLLAESVNDVATVQHNLLKNVADSEAALIAQSRQTRDLQQSLMRIRTVPLSTLTDRMYRIVRQTAKDLGKKVNLEIRGARMEIDRSVLEKMTSPFEHLLRNAVDHGLEGRESRLQAGKPEIGEILIEARQEGNEMILTLSDDGAGIDVDKVKAKAIEQGWIAADDQRPDSELLELIFRAGLSTADTLTQVSGRGIGMDVVKNEIESLGGRVNVTSARGQGTVFTMRLPLTLAVTQTVLVNVGTHQYAIPSGLVEQVQELKVEALNRCYAEKGVEWQGQMYPFWYLPRLLGDEATMPEIARYNTILLLKSANRRVAIHVDSLTRNQEVVVKNIGPQLARVVGVAGATVLGSGQIVLIINPVELMVHADRLLQVPATSSTYVTSSVIQQQPHILVVDDSLTVRKITSRLLERQGFVVMTAKDGVDALQQIEDYKPDVMLVDIEMPRMDGFELTRNVRGNAATKDIPIIIISSRTADKHRKVAEDLGVNKFLGKPYQEDELLSEIRLYLDKQVVEA